MAKEKHQNLEGSPWIPCPARPDGQDQTRRKTLSHNALRPYSERCGPLAENVIHHLARLVAEQANHRKPVVTRNTPSAALARGVLLLRLPSGQGTADGKG